mgnify:CR=1 FL=1
MRIRNDLAKSVALNFVSDTFNSFEFILLMTGGGPGGSTNTLAMYMYNLAFGQSNTGIGRVYGYSSAIGVLLMIILMCIRAIMGKLTKKESIQY